MKPLVKIILSFLILGFFLTSCAPKYSHVQGQLDVHQIYVKCPSPQKPIYEQMLDTEYFLGPNNSKTLLENMEIQKEYIKDLETDIECYEKQVK